MKRSRSPIIWREQGGASRAYGDFRFLGGSREALCLPGTKRGVTDPELADVLFESWRRFGGFPEGKAVASSEHRARSRPVVPPRGPARSNRQLGCTHLGRRIQHRRRWWGVVVPDLPRTRAAALRPKLFGQVSKRTNAKSTSRDQS